MADRYTQTVTVSQELTRTHSLYKHFHLSAGSLSFPTGITKEQAIQMVKNCPLSMEFLPVPHLGINPRGLLQMDGTHVASFGDLQFVQVFVDTFSRQTFASAHSGEKVRNVKSHRLQACAYMVVPKQIKSDNGLSLSGKVSISFVRILKLPPKLASLTTP